MRRGSSVVVRHCFCLSCSLSDVERQRCLWKAEEHGNEDAAWMWSPYLSASGATIGMIKATE